MTFREQGRVDAGRREIGGRITNFHVPSAAREGDGTPTGTAPTSIVVYVATPNPPPVSLFVGATQQVLATVYNAAGAVIPGATPSGWTSSDPSVLTVDGNGLVTGVHAGSASVTATLNTVTSNTLDLTVVAVPDVPDTTPASIVVSPSTLSLRAGAPQTLSAVIKNAGGVALALSPTSWTSSDVTKATVNSSGVVTWVGAGTTTITAHYNAIASNGCVVTALVDADTVADSVVVSPTTLTLQSGAPQTLSAVVKNAAGTALALSPTSWTSTNTAVATVNSSGVVTWVAAGSASVTAHYNAIDSNACAVTAIAFADTTPASIAITPTSVTLAEGHTQQLSAVVKNAAGEPIAGVQPSGWSSANAGRCTVNATGLVTAVAAGGAVNVTATYLALTSNACAVTVSVPASTDATLPRTTLTTTVASTPSNGSTITVHSGGNVQAAFTAAVPGDTIILDRGVTFPTTGLSISPKTGGIAGEWITVKLSAGSFVAEGTRLTAADAVTYNLPNLQLTGFGPLISTQQSVAWNDTGKWRFIGLECSIAPGVTQVNGLILIGDGSPNQNTLAKVPTNFIFDRCYIHGNASCDLRTGIRADCARFACIDSTITECHSAFDAQAIASSNGPGPFKIHNCLLEGAAENINFGGANAGIPGLVPADITITNNHIRKDTAWRGVWLEKELIESKNGKYGLIEGNVLENAWVDGQVGWCLGFWSANQNSEVESETSHWTVQNNVFRNTASGFSVTAQGSLPVNVRCHHITIRNNVLIGLANSSIGQSGAGVGFSLWDIEALTLEHNTMCSAGGEPAFSWAINPPPSQLTPSQTIKNNIVGGTGWYQINTAYGQGQTAWDLVHGAGSAFLGNVIMNPTFQGLGGYIAGNFYVAAFDTIGFVGGGSKAADVTATLADLTIAASSAYYHMGTDGASPGADMTAVAAAVAGVGGGF